MLTQHLTDLELDIDIALSVMRPGQTLNALLARILIDLGRELPRLDPAWVLVHGDTTTALGAAITAFQAGIPVGHVEAGLRTNNLNRPFPEEANRQLIDRISAHCFAPTRMNWTQLRSEYIPDNRITVTGNTAIDAIQWMAERAQPSEIMQDLVRWRGSRKLVLVTAHRREQFGEGIRSICAAIKSIASRREDVCFAYPVHANPQISDAAYELLSSEARVRLMAPMNYQDFVVAIANATIVLTDSGGLQEEAPALNKPVLVMREETERQEAIEAGTVKLVGTDPARVSRAVEELIDNDAAYEHMANARNPYGDGKAAQRIIDALEALT